MEDAVLAGKVRALGLWSDPLQWSGSSAPAGIHPASTFTKRARVLPKLIMSQSLPPLAATDASVRDYWAKLHIQHAILSELAVQLLLRFKCEYGSVLTQTSSIAHLEHNLNAARAPPLTGSERVRFLRSPCAPPPSG